jgi:hypothetical protein
MDFVVKDTESPNCRTHFLQMLKKGPTRRPTLGRDFYCVRNDLLAAVKLARDDIHAPYIWSDFFLRQKPHSKVDTR